MPDRLSTAILELHNELETFGNFQIQLKSAHERLAQAEQEWEKLTKEQQQTALSLVGSTKDAIAATQEVAAHAKILTETLIPLAKAIQEVNFPLRLDKIDMAVATQASSMSTQTSILTSFQEMAKGGFNNLNVAFGRVQKKENIITALLVVNLITLFSFIVLFYLGKVPAR